MIRTKCRPENGQYPGLWTIAHLPRSGVLSNNPSVAVTAATPPTAPYQPMTHRIGAARTIRGGPTRRCAEGPADEDMEMVHDAVDRGEPPSDRRAVAVKGALSALARWKAPSRLRPLRPQVS